MNCAELEQLICDYVDGTLTADRKAEVDRHLEACPGCAEVARDCAAAVAFMERAADVEPPPELITRILFDAPWSRKAPAKTRGWLSKLFAPIMRLIFIPFVIITVIDGQWLWALGLLVAAALSDALDGLLARVLHQQTMLGQYLDPIADKLLLSSLFLVLSFVRKIPWKYTILVFSRDLCIVATAVVLYATVGFRDFRPSIYGKLNTGCQIAAVFFVVLAQVLRVPWVLYLQTLFLYATFIFATISGVHYVLITGRRLRHQDQKPAA